MSRYALPSAGSVTKLSIYLAPTGTAGSQVLEGIVYSDSSGAPATLLGTSSPLTFTSTSATGWYELTFPTPLNLAAGNYWIGVITGATSNVAGFRYTTRRRQPRLQHEHLHVRAHEHLRCGHHRQRADVALCDLLVWS